MDWLWIILRYLFPNDPARLAAEVARSCVTMMVKLVFCETGLAALERHGYERIYIEGIVRDYEATIHLAIAVRACQIAGVRFNPAARPLHFPARAMSLPQLLKRIHALVALCDDIERLAQLRAVQLKRAHDADPLGLAAHGSPRGGAAINSNHEAVGALSSLGCEAGGGGGAPRSGVTEGAGRNAAGARAPPIFDVFQNPATRLAGFTCEAATRCAAPQTLTTCLRKTSANDLA